MKRIMMIGILVLMSFSVNAATVSHSASEVMPGSFASGDFYFSGLVGVGTTQPTQALHVVGNINVTGDIFTSSDSIYIGTKKLTNDAGVLKWGSESIGVALTNDTDGDGKFPPADCNDNTENVGTASDGTCDGDGDGYIDVSSINGSFGADCSSLDPFDGDAEYNGSGLGFANDGTCDGDEDGYIDLSVRDGNLINIDMDDNNVNINKNITIIYVATTPHNGNFGGRSGLDSFCSNNKPSGLQCRNIHAFISVGLDDDIELMPDNYDYDGALYWYHSSAKNLTKFADSWSDALDGSIAVTQQTGTGTDATYVWSGSYASGHSSDPYDCNDWTTISGNAYYGLHHWTDNSWLSEALRGCNYNSFVRCACTP